MKKSKEALTGALQQFASALRNATLYPDGHPALDTPVKLFFTALTEILNEREKIAIGLIDDVLVIDEMPFYEANTRFAAIFAALEEQCLEAVTFLPGLTIEELRILIPLLLGIGDYAEESVREDVMKDRLPHINLRDAFDGDDDPRAKALTTYQESLTVMIDLMTEVRLGQIPSTSHASAVIGNMRDLILSEDNALLGLTQLKAYDNYTYHHSVNVAILSLSFAHSMGLPEEMVKKVGLAGLLHDLGKVRMAEGIIKKPGALTEDEMRIMRRHPELGAEIVETMPGMDGETHDIVLHHHMRFDGTGYPNLAAGTEIHPQGTFVALADCYDALTTTRPYQKSRHPSEAIRIMRHMSGKAYAPDVLNSFVGMLGTYPVGEVVRLSSNELAVVTALNHLDATSPKIRLVSDADGSLLTAPIDCDLAEETSRSIVDSVNPLTKGIDVGKVLGS